MNHSYSLAWEIFVLSFPENIPTPPTEHLQDSAEYVFLFGPPSPLHWKSNNIDFIVLCEILPTRKGTMCICVEAYQGHMPSMLCAMPTVFVHYLTEFPSAKEQQFMCLIIQLTGHYSRGMLMMMKAGFSL